MDVLVRERGDVLVRERGDVLDLAGGDQLTGGAELDDALSVDGVPGDDRVDDDREAECLLALLVGVRWRTWPSLA